MEIQLVLLEFAERRPLNVLQVLTNTFKLPKALYNTDIWKHPFHSIVASGGPTGLWKRYDASLPRFRLIILPDLINRIHLGNPLSISNGSLTSKQQNIERTDDASVVETKDTSHVTATRSLTLRRMGLLCCTRVLMQ